MKADCPCYVVKLDQVGYHYPDGTVALEKVTFGVERGEKIALLGPNGCGKSTMLKILGGIHAPTVGTFVLDDEQVTEKSLNDASFAQRLHRRIGFVFENSDAQLFCPTVRDEILFGPLQMNLSIADCERRLHDVVRLLEIESLLDRSPYKLSAGQKKRVALAAVLSIGPDVLLLDEPTNTLDPRSQHSLLHLLGLLHSSGKTIVTTTHDLTILPDIADRVFVLDDDHRPAFEGTPRQLLDDPRLMLKLNLIHEHACERMLVEASR